MKPIGRNFVRLAVVGLLFCILGCAFAGDPHNTGPNGFFSGLWDGTVLIWSIIMAIFTKVTIVEHYNSGWPYHLGLAIGAFAFSYNIGLVLGVISVGLYIFHSLPA